MKGAESVRPPRFSLGAAMGRWNRSLCLRGRSILPERGEGAAVGAVGILGIWGRLGLCLEFRGSGRKGDVGGICS